MNTRNNTRHRPVPENSRLRKTTSATDIDKLVNWEFADDSSEEEEVAINTASQPERLTMAEVNILPSSIFQVQPAKFNGASKGQTWLQEFDRWAKLHKLSDDQAAQALPFYLEGSAKLWFESLNETIQTNYNRLKQTLVARFKNHQSEDDDLFITQAPTEQAVEFLERLQIKAIAENIPEHLHQRIALKGFKQSLRGTIIARNPQNFEELRTAAIIAEKVEKDTKRGAQISAINSENVQCLQDSINALTKKVENLETGRRPQNDYKQQSANWHRTPQFGNGGQNSKHTVNGGQNRTPRFGNGSRNWGQKQYTQKPQNSFRPQNTNYQNKASCTSCGMNKCSGNPENCFAIGKQCGKCLKIGHFAQVCRSIYDINGTKIRH